MKGLFLALIVLAACAAQAQPLSPCLKLTKVEIDHHMLRQQDESKATLSFKAQNCYILDSPQGPAAMFEDLPGLDIVTEETRFARFNVGGPLVMRARELSMSWRLTASPDLSVGEHTLHALLIYYAADKSGKIFRETLAFELPLKVAPPKAYHPPKMPAALVRALETAGDALATLLEIPIWIVLTIACALGGDCTC